MSDEVKSLINGTEASSQVSAARANFSSNDLFREISATLSENQLEKRILALTNPTQYHADLKEEMKKAKEIANANYATVYEQYMSAGLTHEQSKTLSIQSAKGIYQSFLDTIRLNYPEAGGSLYAIGAKGEADRAAVGQGSTPFSMLSPSDIAR
jgi:hypothetical protein